jgi:hypothetical protein
MRLIALSIATFALAAVAGNVHAQEATKPDRAATIQYINNVIAKTNGAVITVTPVIKLAIAQHSLHFDVGTKTYRIFLQETGQQLFPGEGIAFADVRLDRSGWSLRNLESVEELSTMVISGQQQWPSTELRRIKLTFRAESVRELNTARTWGTKVGTPDSTKTYFNGTRNFVSLFFRAGDPDDATRLRNALLRLKELDGEVKDPFLN